MMSYDEGDISEIHSPDKFSYYIHVCTGFNHHLAALISFFKDKVFPFVCMRSNRTLSHRQKVPLLRNGLLHIGYLPSMYSMRTL